MVFCANSNSPINLIKADSQECDNKCLYEYNYGKSSLIGHNFKTHLEFTMKNNKDNAVFFYGKYYNIEKILLFRDSVHTINNNKKSAELVIVHQDKGDPSKKLVVCILIKIVNQNNSDLDYIIENMELLAPNKDDLAELRFPSFSLNKIIPKSKYFNYRGNLFYESNNSDLCDINKLHDIIVFDEVITINNNTYNKLRDLINRHSFNIQNSENTPTFYSKKKAVLGTGIMGEDDIYIECKPTGDGDKKNMRVDVAVKKDNKFEFFKIFLEKIFRFLKFNSSEIMGSFLGAIIIYIVLKTVKNIG